MRKTLKPGPWAAYIAALIRTQYGGNQSALARECQVTPQTVNRWVNAEAVPRQHVLVRLASATGRPLSELIAVAYGASEDDARLAAQVEALVTRVPATELERILATLEEARAAKRITSRDYRAAQQAITLAAEAQLYKLLRDNTAGGLPDASAALP